MRSTRRSEGSTRQVNHQLPRPLPPAVLPEEDPLPGAEGEAAVQDGDSERGRGQRRTDVRRHVVGPFFGVGVERVTLGSQTGEPVFEIAARFGISVGNVVGSNIANIGLILAGMRG